MLYDNLNIDGKTGKKKHPAAAQLDAVPEA